MTRLQKKCLIAAAGAHLLVVVALFCSGFIPVRTKPDNAQVLTMIPANIIDAAFQSGVRSAQPPPPAPTPVVQPPQPQPQPQPQPKPEPPKPAPPVKTIEPPPEPPQPPDLKAVEPIEPKPKPKPAHKIDISLKPVEHKNITEPDRHEAEAKAEAKAEAEREEKAAKEARRLQQARVRALERAANAVKSNTSSSTTVDLPGDSTQAYADYASVVKTVYTDAWRLPEDAANDDANVKVSVTIQRDGRVSEAHIVEKSGDASLDNSVQRTLDRVHEIEPFPDGATDQERTYIINFNLKAKRQLLG